MTVFRLVEEAEASRLINLEFGKETVGEARGVLFNANAARQCPLAGVMRMTGCVCPLSRSLLGAKRTSLFAMHLSAFDPKRTSPSSLKVQLEMDLRRAGDGPWSSWIMNLARVHFEQHGETPWVSSHLARKPSSTALPAQRLSTRSHPRRLATCSPGPRSLCR